jgi:chemotaxis protein methyltransferase CheR
MNALPAAPNIERFRAVVERCLGLRFDESRLAVLSGVFERLGAAGGGFEAYLARLEQPNPPRDELRALAHELTIGETYFFRNIAQFHAFTDVALRELAGGRGGSRRQRILSAGCASGEEAYSLAICVCETLGDASRDVSVTGIDVNTTSLEKAARGVYSQWSLRETPPDVARRWFRASGRGHALDPSIRDRVLFQERNLADDEPGFWFPEAFDVIFCRNVLMYFAPDHARAAMARMTRSLTPGGYLFLGHAETMRGLSDEFQLCHTHGTFYYQRPARAALPARDSWAHARAAVARSEDRGDRSPGTDLESPASDTELAALDADPAWTSTWVDTVQRSSDRIRLLSQRRVTSTDSNGAFKHRPSAPPPDVAGALELLARERFADALELLGDLPRTAERDPDALLLRAVLLTHSGQLNEAEVACAELCAANERNAGAHYLLALCREARGDRKGARQHDEAAAKIDPRFAMPRLHLGLLARRAGDMAVARRELEAAAALLANEETSRILLYGGGFTRETLTALCRAEIQAAGGCP